MSRASVAASNRPKRFKALLESMSMHSRSGGASMHTVFSDFCESTSLAYQQVPFACPDREARYMKIADRYGSEGMNVFAECLALIVMELDERYCDFLGQAFMLLELYNHWKGQFFTPYDLSVLLAEMVLDDQMEAKIAENGFITVDEPACGAGGMLVAFAAAMRKRGLNFQTQACFQATDVCRTSAHMTHIQMSVLGFPGIVRIGNTLSNEVSQFLPTPAYHLGLWSFRLRAGKSGSTPDIIGERPAITGEQLPEDRPPEQAMLF